MLHKKILETARLLGIKEFTEVQKTAFEKVISGKNCLIIAPTGSGKTEAALLPILNRMLENPGKPIQLLYITPLRALNRDLMDRIRKWGEMLNFSVDVRHGDTSTHIRAKQAKTPPDILITTPETLQSILPAKKMGVNLKNVKYVIIDEIHELFAEKRGYQLSVGLERLRERAGDFQRVGLSATVGDPSAVANFLGENTEIIDVTGMKKYILTVSLPKPDAKTKKEAKKSGLNPEVYARVKKLLEILGKHKQVLTFVNTRNMAEQLSFYMSFIHEGTDVHHSSLSKEVRITTERLFKKGEIRHLIATSSMELGIDIGNVDAVVQYGSPRQVVRLLQRVGRSGHRWDLPSIGYIICTDERDFIEAAVISKLALRRKIEKQNIEECPLDVLAHQVAGIVMDYGDVSFDRVYKIVKRAYPFKNLKEEDLYDVVAQLERERYVKVRGDIISKTRETWKYYYSNLSMIPDEEKFFVVDITTGRNTAVLDEDFVISYLDPGTTFVVKGKPWRVVGIEEKNVYAEPSELVPGAIPAWVGEQIPVERFVAEEVWRELKRMEKKETTLEEVCDSESLKRAIKKYEKSGADLEKVVIEHEGKFVVVLYPLGSKGNAALSRILAGEITRRYGIPVRTFSTPYSTILEFPSEGGEKVVETVLKSLDSSLIEVLFENYIIKSNLFRWRFMHVAKRFGLITPGAKVEKAKIRRLVELLLDSPVYKETIKEILVEKLDIQSVKHMLDLVKNGAVKIEIRKMGVLGREELMQTLNIPEVLSQTPEKALIEMFKKRVLQKSIKILCTSCLSERGAKVSDPPERCPKCGSKMLALVHDVEEAKEVLKKKKISRKDEKKIAEIIRRAELFSQFGKKAIIALCVTGVGTRKAAKILTTPYSEDEFWKALLEAEREYYRTKMFWS